MKKIKYILTLVLVISMLLSQAAIVNASEITPVSGRNNELPADHVDNSG